MTGIGGIGLAPSAAASPPPPLQPTNRSGGSTASFLEPITGQTIPRSGDQSVHLWIAGLPHTDVGLSTLDHWQAGASPEVTAERIRADLSAEITPLPAGLQLETSLLDGYRAQVDNVKVGYAMGQVAADIEARVAANPSVPHDSATALAQELRNQGAVLSYGAAREATTAPNVYAFNGRCYADANAMARAAITEFNNPASPTIREYTPAMQQRDAQAAMDRSVLGQADPLGVSWGQTAWMYARGNGASLEQQQQAYTLGTGGDALLGIAGSFAGAGAAREGIALPGGQARPIGSTRAAELRSNLEVVVRPPVRASEFRATSSLQGQRLSLQFTAEQAAGARAPTRISSYSDHALEQIAGRDGGIGVRQSAIDDAFANPVNIKYQPSKYGPTFQFVGRNATTAVNTDGKVTTVWANNSEGTAQR